MTGASIAALVIRIGRKAVADGLDAGLGSGLPGLARPLGERDQQDRVLVATPMAMMAPRKTGR